MLEGALDLDIDEYVERDGKGGLRLSRKTSRLMNEQGGRRLLSCGLRPRTWIQLIGSH